MLEIHFLEMKKLKGYNENDDLSQWINFIKADSKDVLESMAKVNPNIDKAVHVLTTMSQDKKSRAEYLSREMALHDEATRIEEAMEEGYEKGIEQGIEQGIEKTKIEDAKNLLRLGVDYNLVVKAIGLSSEIVKKLSIEVLEENNN
ncbi:hypothetical protein JCM1393_07790 [Clostridium carnis]